MTYFNTKTYFVLKASIKQVNVCYKDKMAEYLSQPHSMGMMRGF